VIRYRYLTQVDPPAPFVHITLRNPVSGSELRDVPAQLDTAADQPLLPEALALALGLSQLSTTRIGTVGGAMQMLPTYAVLLGIHDLPGQRVEVVAHLKETHVLLGRDVLNAHRIVLDGPQLALEIG